MSDEMLTTKCLAKRANVHPVTVRKWRAKGEGPRYLKKARETKGYRALAKLQGVTRGYATPAFLPI